MLLRGLGWHSEVESVMIAAALRLKAAKGEDPSEELDEDNMWLWAGEAAAAQGRLLTLYSIANAAPATETRAQLMALLRSALKER